MNLRSLRCFVILAEELNFGRAARRLNMSQPPLTQHIKSLEQELGAQLFYRTRRSVRISETGSALLDVARLLLAQARGLPREQLLNVEVGHGALFGLQVEADSVLKEGL